MIWDLYPTFIRLVDTSPVRILLVFDSQRQQLVGATVADDVHGAAALLGDLITSWGEPAFVRALPNPLFADLDDAVGEVLAGHGLHRTTQPVDDDVLWVLAAGPSTPRSIDARTPASAAQLAAALAQLTLAASASRRRRPDE